MSFQPRYSLLTLLVLTALVAGGVKWWRGPHHVVEKVPLRDEVEYTYSRDAWGNRVIEGPLILRNLHVKRVESFCVYYYRQGVLTNWAYQASILTQPGNSGPHVMFEQSCPLPEEDRQIFYAACRTELQSLAAQGLQHVSTSEGPLPDGFDFDPNR